MPCARGRVHTANVLDDGALAAHDAEEEQVVLERVGADAEVAAVRCDAPCDARALIDAAGDRIEAHREREVFARAIAFVDGERKERERLHAVEKFGVALAVEALGLVREARGRDALPPFAAIDEQAVSTLLLARVPITD